MIVLNCECGETYRADEKHLGYSIRCNKCQRIIRVARFEQFTLSSREEPAIEYIPPEPIHSPSAPKRSFTSKRSFLNNRLVPVVGILALVTGVTLTIINLRARKVETQTSNVISQPSLISAAATPIKASSINVPGNSKEPSPSVRPSPVSSVIKSQTATPTIDFSDVAQPATSPAISQSSQESTRNEVQIPSPTPSPVTVRYPNGTNLIRPRI
jgi:hypothetical protein